jgi:hypothetical protein
MKQNMLSPVKSQLRVAEADVKHQNFRYSLRNPFLLHHALNNGNSIPDNQISSILEKQLLLLSNSSNLSLIQLRELSVLLMQIVILSNSANGVVNNTMLDLNLHIRALVNQISSRFIGASLPNVNLDSNGLKCLRVAVYILSSLCEMYIRAFVIEALDEVVNFVGALLKEVAIGAISSNLKDKEREKLALYCRLLGIFGSICKYDSINRIIESSLSLSIVVLSSRKISNEALENKKIGLCQDIVQLVLVGLKGSDSSNKRSSPTIGLIVGYLPAIESSRNSAAITSTLPQRRSRGLDGKSAVPIQQRRFSIGNEIFE